jgi:hypothetical protein
MRTAATVDVLITASDFPGFSQDQVRRTGKAHSDEQLKRPLAHITSPAFPLL